MNQHAATAQFNSSSPARLVKGNRVIASLQLLLVWIFAATGEQAGVIVAVALLTFVWPYFVFAWRFPAAFKPTSPASYRGSFQSILKPVLRPSYGMR